MAAPAWLAALEPRAPDVVAVWQTIDDEEPVIRALAFRREIRRRAGTGSAARILAQHEAIADALGVRPERPARSAAARARRRGRLERGPGLRPHHRLAALAGARRRPWPRGASGRPTRRGSCRASPVPRTRIASTLLLLLAKSRRSLATSAEAIAGHESEPCPLDHPLVGHLRCGEWLLFAGVHDLMHLEQLHGLKEGAARWLSARRP